MRDTTNYREANWFETVTSFFPPIRYGRAERMLRGYLMLGQHESLPGRIAIDTRTIQKLGLTNTKVIAPLQLAIKTSQEGGFRFDYDGRSFTVIEHSERPMMGFYDFMTTDRKRKELNNTLYTVRNLATNEEMEVWGIAVDLMKYGFFGTKAPGTLEDFPNRYEPEQIVQFFGIK